MPEALHLPYRQGDAKQVGHRLFRKQILPVGKIEHEGETLNFTREYLEGLRDSFNGGAFDQVPFLLANERNEHHSDPEKFRGELRGVEVDADGLHGLIELSEDGTKLIEANPSLGVSARIIRGEGKDALQHVLGTLDPKATGMKAWEQVSLSAHADAEAVDLTGESFSESVPDPNLSDEERTTLRTLAAKAKGQDELSDEEAEKVVAQLLDEAEKETDSEKKEPVAALSDDDRKTVELAEKRAKDADERVRSVEATLATERFERKRDELLQAGVPPAVVELAEPVLRGGPGVIELSNGTRVDAHTAMSKMLDEFRGMIDLSTIGVGDGDPGSEEAEAKQIAKDWKARS